MGKVYTRFQTKTAQNPHPMGRHILGLHQGVNPPPHSPPRDVVWHFGLTQLFLSNFVLFTCMCTHNKNNEIMKRQSVKFPWDLYWENKTYKLQSYIESIRNMFSNITEHPGRGGYPGKLRPEVYPRTLLNTIFDRKGTPFVYLPLTNVTLFTNLVKNFALL